MKLQRIKQIRLLPLDQMYCPYCGILHAVNFQQVQDKEQEGYIFKHLENHTVDEVATDLIALEHPIQ